MNALTTANAVFNRIAEAGYQPSIISRGLDWAYAQGATSERELYRLAMARILYSDAQLADGARFSA